MDAAGYEAPAGEDATEVPDMTAEGADQVPAQRDDTEREGDKTGDGVKGCGDAGPAPHEIGLGSASGYGG